MPNSNPYTPQHSVSPSGTPAPDTANAYQSPTPLRPQPECPAPSTPTATPPHPRATPGPTCTPSPAAPPQAAMRQRSQG